MTYLIDTHILLFHMFGEARLSKLFIEEIQKKENVIFISKASLWEIAIKVSTGKLKLNGSVSLLKNYLAQNLFTELDFDFEDLQCISELPFHHNDPFDRMIISQAITRNLTIITDDSKFQYYPVQLLTK